MTNLSDIVNDLGGIATKRALVRRGATDRHLTDAVRSGDVVRVRNGWYSTWSESDPRLRAVRVGGRLTGISAIVELGGWVLDRHPLHVALPVNASRLRSQTNRRRRLDPRNPGRVVLHWESRDRGDRGSSTMVGLHDALVRVALDENWETTIAAFDWALHTGRIDTIDLESILLDLPADLQSIRDWVDPACESLPESLTRTRARMAGLEVRSQHSLATTERLDLVVEDVVGLDIDGEEFHVHRFFADRDKDLTATIEGFHTIRPSAVHVFHDWSRVLAAIESALAMHRSAPRAGNSGLEGALKRLLRPKPPRVSRRRARTPEFPARPRSTGMSGVTGMRRMGPALPPA